MARAGKAGLDYLYVRSAYDAEDFWDGLKRWDIQEKRPPKGWPCRDLCDYSQAYNCRLRELPPKKPKKDRIVRKGRDFVIKFTSEEIRRFRGSLKKKSLPLK